MRNTSRVKSKLYNKNTGKRDKDATVHEKTVMKSPEAVAVLRESTKFGNMTPRS